MKNKILFLLMYWNAYYRLCQLISHYFVLDGKAPLNGSINMVLYSYCYLKRCSKAKVLLCHNVLTVIMIEIHGGTMWRYHWNSFAIFVVSGFTENYKMQKIKFYAFPSRCRFLRPRILIVFHRSRKFLRRRRHVLLWRKAHPGF